jgi:hypothetical protein
MHCWKQRHSVTASATYAWMPWRHNMDLLVPAGTSTRLDWIQCGFSLILVLLTGKTGSTAYSIWACIVSLFCDRCWYLALTHSASRFLIRKKQIYYAWTDAVNRGSGFRFSHHKCWIENGHSKFFIIINIMRGGENCVTLCGVPEQAQAVNLLTLVNAIWSAVLISSSLHRPWFCHIGGLHGATLEEFL